MFKRITKKEQGEFLKYKLSTDSKWAKIALLRIYRDQRNMRSNTYSPNGFGFSGFDRNTLEPLARKVENQGKLSTQEMNLLKGKIKKYWRQILKITDIEKLNLLIKKSKLEI
jgi:hypothetical protein